MARPAGETGEEAVELRKEASTMALYVAICLLAALSVALIALVGYAVARGSGATRARSVLYAASILLVATVVALVKNVLAGH